MFTNKQKLEALNREVKYRERVYARRCELGRMTIKQADYQIAIFRSIAEDYQQKAREEQLL